MSRRWGKLFVGLFVFLGPGRLIRPVRCLRTGQTEWIGQLRQQKETLPFWWSPKTCLIFFVMMMMMMMMIVIIMIIMIIIITATIMIMIMIMIMIIVFFYWPFIFKEAASPYFSWAQAIGAAFPQRVGSTQRERGSADVAGPATRRGPFYEV